MLIRVGFDIEFNLPAPAPMLLCLSLHPSRWPDVRSAEYIRVEPEIPLFFYTDRFGNRCGRIDAPAGPLRLSNDAVVEDSGQPDAVNWSARQHPVADLPPDVLQFLLASRYCEVDLLAETAWNLFGGYAPGWSRVQAVCDFVHNHVTFGYAFARNTRTANEVYKERVGVCRDFAHLAVTLCRGLNIPARYVTGYLGDFGIPYNPAPMDFSAWFEAYLDGRWWTFDARHNVPRIGRVLMAVGRDAVDVALTTCFGPSQLVKFVVKSDDVSGGM
jgi:transglutaminase-like putative cysteine protease